MYYIFICHFSKETIHPKVSVRSCQRADNEPRLVTFALMIHCESTNLIAGKEVAKEFIQKHATPDAVAQEALRLLRDPEAREAIRQELHAVRQQLGEPGAADRAAKVIADTLNKL